MHIHILGICGTFMGGVAALARAAGHRVTGVDAGVYPPMSDQLAALGIEVAEGYQASDLDLAPDVFVIGNAMSRGNPLVETILNANAPYMSGPEWLAREVLCQRRVIAVAGTHGKTTTASIVAHVLDSAGIDAGFLIGGVPANFGTTARLGSAPWFVVEADEYDTAFFDKRAKFVHYRPEIAILNNLEFDHADIYPNLAAIERQFHHLVRTVPGNGSLVVNSSSVPLESVLAQGAWSPIARFGSATDNVAVTAEGCDDSHHLRVGSDSLPFSWPLSGEHNQENAAAAATALLKAGLSAAQIVAGLSTFAGVARRQQVLFDHADMLLLDDFAHHPTAMEKTLTGLRQRYPGRRIITAMEPRSNTMQAGVHADRLASALEAADEVLVYRPPQLSFDIAAALAPLGSRCQLFDDYKGLGDAIVNSMQTNSIGVLMSNGGFGTLRQDVPAALERRYQHD